MPFSASILVVADEFLLLGVNRDRRCAMSQLLLDLGVDELELRIAIGVTPSFIDLSIGLQAEV